MAAPPSAAPSALPRLNAPTLTVAHRGAHGQQDLRAREHPQLAAHVRTLAGLALGPRQPQRGDGDQAQGRRPAEGKPPILARVRPMNMAAMALACFSRGTRLAATTAPMPKKAPWLRLVIRRDSNRVE
ncbi:Uncharacterised protein [Bordetella pertussis]|nr:Uncharacterised protein [Bordetella pertussis]